MANPQIFGVLGVERNGRLCAVDFPIEKVLSTRRYLRHGCSAACAVVETQKHPSSIIGRNGFSDPFDLTDGVAGESFNLADRTGALLMERVQIGHHGGDTSAGDELNIVEPMRTNIGDCAQIATLFRFQSPVPIGLEQQPVL